MGERLVSGVENAAFGHLALVHSVQGADLSRYDTDDQPVIANLENDYSLPWAERYAANYLDYALSEAFSTGQLACQPGGAAKDGNNQRQGQPSLQVGAG